MVIGMNTLLICSKCTRENENVQNVCLHHCSLVLIGAAAACLKIQPNKQFFITKAYHECVKLTHWHLQEEWLLGKLFRPSDTRSGSPVHSILAFIWPSGKQRWKQSGLGLRLRSTSEILANSKSMIRNISTNILIYYCKTQFLGGQSPAEFVPTHIPGGTAVSWYKQEL